MRRLVMAVLTVLLASVSATSGAVWQWSVNVQNAEDRGEGPPRAFLWIPPSCQRVRAVIVGQNNMEEEPILENRKFREALGALNVAEVWTTPAFSPFFRFDKGAGEVLAGMMNDLASESGYDELRFAPIIGIGHSATASWPFYLAAWNPDRTLACISVSGQWPFYRGEPFAPDIWGDRNIDTIPGLVTLGEYESADGRAGEGLKQRAAHPLMPMSMLACPAEGHFAPTEKKIEYLALYIRKAMQYRLPEQSPIDGPVKLKAIDPTKQGWLVDRWRYNTEPTAAAAPVAEYKGDPKQAFWFFDEELAKATEVYQSACRNKKADLIGYVQDGKVVPQNPKAHQQVDLKFQPAEDGLTFKLTGVFLDIVPPGRPVAWTGLAEGAPVSHASGGGPISVDRICGPIVKLSPDTFQVCFDKVGMNNKRRSNAIWFAATHAGDDEFKPAVQQALMNIPLRNTKGKPQTITFAPIPDQAPGAGAIKLSATSDAGLPVRFYVLSGPANIDGDMLTLTEVPVRAKFPVKVTVVAWQYGRATEPAIKTAEPVEQTFLVTKEHR